MIYIIENRVETIEKGFFVVHHYPSDHEILIKFIKGLPDQFAFFVRAGHHSESANCLAAVKIGEAYGYRKDDAPLVAAANKSADNTPVAVKDLNNFKTDVVSELQGQINSPTQAVSNLATDFSQQLVCTRDVKGNDQSRSAGLFVTEENPDLGFTYVVQHQICLKPDFKPKHQISYLLTPEKKDILRHHLDELLRHGVNAPPVDKTEDVSSVVLVSKRTNKNGKANTSSKETSLSKFRFCCDLRRIVHIIRLKSAYVRKPNPSKYFMDPVLTKLKNVEVQDHTSLDEDSTPVKDNSTTNYENLLENISDADNTRKSDNISFVQNNKAMSRPKRHKKLPARFKDQNFVNFSEVDVSSESTSASQLKVKRFLAQKIKNGNRSYLAHIVGEPAQHASWLQENQLGPKANAKLNSRPPPQIKHFIFVIQLIVLCQHIIIEIVPRHHLHLFSVHALYSLDLSHEYMCSTAVYIYIY
ncbi:unnamed protein product [Mytilus coruscus]|uniref:Uncharacterized protein n=1 Tax=Mytilus coruscus TaxID=42192 RepID=A0A6J8E4L4_MYTCO|nr:unnamed protein product [Mytilus coruscus]